MQRIEAEWPLLLSGRWLYRWQQGQWLREALDASAPTRALTAAQWRRQRTLLLLRRAATAPGDALQLAESACLRLRLPPLQALPSRLPATALPRQLQLHGRDRYGRPLYLLPQAAIALRRMIDAARRDGIEIDAVSGFRSPGYQAELWRRKLAAGQSLAQIARVSAPPGRSEHHSGRAVDLASGPGPVLEPAFGRTAACRWLRRHAASFGFVETYPAGNGYAVMAEPWHWCWHPRPWLGAVS